MNLTQESRSIFTSKLAYIEFDVKSCLNLTIDHAKYKLESCEQFSKFPASSQWPQIQGQTENYIITSVKYLKLANYKRRSAHVNISLFCNHPIDGVNVILLYTYSNSSDSEISLWIFYIPLNIRAFPSPSCITVLWSVLNELWWIADECWNRGVFKWLSQKGVRRDRLTWPES